MRRFSALCLSIFLVLASYQGAWAEEKTEEKSTKWHLLDLYYHDAEDVMVGLNLAPKLAVRFKSEVTPEKRSKLLARFSPIAERVDPRDPLRLLVEFQASTKTNQILGALNEISRSGLAEVQPVFYVGNIEAIIEGIVVEPKITLTPDRLLERMKMYGDFSVRQSIPTNGSWFFMIDEIKPPLNILVLTNLLHKDSWVRHAYPSFMFLHDAITASVSVEPVSGTVGEKRTVTLTIKVFDPEITLLEDQLPQFYSGLFRPIGGNISPPSSIKYPPGYLEKLIAGPTKHPMRTSKRVRTYAFSWEYRIGALGEWTIHPQPISYSKNGIASEIMSSGFTLIVNSQIGNLKIEDMPPPLPLIYPVEKPLPAPEEALPAVPSYWFDEWVLRPEFAARYAHTIGIFFGAVSAVILCALGLLAGIASMRRAAARKERVLNIKTTLNQARSEGSYEKYGEALSAALTTLFPHLSSRLTWDEIKDDNSIREKLGNELMKTLEAAFYELGRMYSKEFVSTPESLAMLDFNIRKISETAEKMLLSGKECT